MNLRRRRRRNWIVLWLVLVSIPLLSYVVYGLALSRAFAQL